MSVGQAVMTTDERTPTPVGIEVFGKYYLFDRIAVGGMGEIFRAISFEAGGFENLVAIKRMVAPPTDDDRFVRMFMDEAKVFAVLQAANIVRMYDFGKVGASYFIAMECVEGKDVKFLLNNLARRRMALPIELAVYIAMEAAKGLDYAHKRVSITGEPLNIVHRDVNPSNILVSYMGEVKIGDFGIVRAVSCAEKTDIGAITGKVAYMSPEQACGVHLDRRSDVFALGVLLHEMLTGRRLFKAASEIETIDRVRRADVKRPSITNPTIPPRLDEIAMRSLELNPDDRYQTARDLQLALLDFLHPLSTEVLQQSLSTFMRELFADEIVVERTRTLSGSLGARQMHESRMEGTDRRPALPLPEFSMPRLTGNPMEPEPDPAGLTMVPAYTSSQKEEVTEARPRKQAAPPPTARPRKSWWQRLSNWKKPGPAMPQPLVPRTPTVEVSEPPKSARARFVESPAPWDGAEAAMDREVPEVRTRLTNRLHGLRDAAATRNDWLFIDRLVRACSTPHLDFPLFPTGARRLDWLLRAGDIDQTQVVEVVIREPGMLKRVWDEASSPAFGATPPANVREAVLRLGHRRLWQIAMSASMNAKVFQARSHQARADHLREVSIVAADVSVIFDPKGEAFLPTLLHGLGKLVVYKCGPSRNPEESASPEFVGAVADLVYPSVGMLLADAWKLGPATAASIGFGPAPDRAPTGQHFQALATRAASIAAHEAWAARESRTFDGFVALTALGFTAQLAARSLDAAEVAWKKGRQATR